MTPALLRWTDLRVGQTASSTFSISPEALNDYAALSGDRNPLHLDDGFAQSRGFEGRVVYGGLIVAQVSRLIGMQLPGRNGIWANLEMSFRQPLYCNEEATLTAQIEHLSDATRAGELSLTVRAEGKKVATGRAEFILKEP